MLQKGLWGRFFDRNYINNEAPPPLYFNMGLQCNTVSAYRKHKKNSGLKFAAEKATDNFLKVNH